MVWKKMVGTGLVTASVAMLAFPADAGLFDGLLGKKAPAKQESEVRFAAPVESELGRAVTPSQYQSLTVPPSEALTPIPDSSMSGYGAAPAPSPTYVPPAGYGPAPSASYSIAPYGVPGQGPAMMDPAMGVGPYGGVPIDAYPPSPETIMEYMPGMPLYPRVKYDDPENVPACAVPKVVAVPDPCAPKNPCATCAPSMVFVKICVPPNECPTVKVESHGKKIKYKYSHGFQVEIEIEKDGIEVDYDD